MTLGIDKGGRISGRHDRSRNLNTEQAKGAIIYSTDSRNDGIKSQIISNNDKIIRIAIIAQIGLYVEKKYLFLYFFSSQCSTCIK